MSEVVLMDEGTAVALDTEKVYALHTPDMVYLGDEVLARLMEQWAAAMPITKLIVLPPGAVLAHLTPWVFRESDGKGFVREMQFASAAELIACRESLEGKAP